MKLKRSNNSSQNIWQIFIIVVLAAFGTTCSLREMPPQTVVEKYCLLDAQGANFSESNPRDKAIFGLLINEDEAGYDESVIVKNYRISKLKTDGKKAEVDVIYTVLGTMSSELKPKKNPHMETVTFHLTFIENSWKIDGLRMLPHISRSWMIDYLHQNLRKDKQAKMGDPQLRATITEITNWM
jgi:hypothetical protein